MLPSGVPVAFYPPLGTEKCISRYWQIKDKGDSNHLDRDLKVVMNPQVPKLTCGNVE